MTCVYSVGPIDYFDGMQNVKSFRNTLRVKKDLSLTEVEEAELYGELWVEDFDEILQRAFDLVKRIEAAYWEGDVIQGPFVFSLPFPDEVSCKLGFMWKQQNNGTTFIVSPERLNHIENELLVYFGDEDL